MYLSAIRSRVAAHTHTIGGRTVVSQGKLKKAVWFVFVSLLAFSLNAAESRAAEEVRAREVKVTATRTEKDLAEIPMSVGVVTSEDQKRDPQTTIADMLSRIPGLTVMDGGMPGGKRIKIRGESPMRSLILIDGVKSSEQKSMSGSAILIDTSQIERIEVIKGPASVLYGSEAIGGVINIITKKGGDKPIGFSQNFIYDTSDNGLEIQSALYGSYKGFNYRFSASGVNADDRWAGDGRISDSDYKNRNYTGQLGYSWDKGDIFLKAEKYESEISIPTNSVTGNIKHGSYAGMYNKTDVSLDLPRWNRESVSGGFELRQLTDFLAKVKVNGYAQNMEKKFNNNIHVYNSATTPMGAMQIIVDQNIRTINEQDSYGGSAQTEWAIGDSHYVIAGVDYNLDKLDAKDFRLGGYTSIKPPTSPSPIIRPSATAKYRYKVEQDALGAFIQDEWTFLRDWTATLGLRQTWVRSELKKNNNPDLENNGDQSDSKLVGNVGLVYSGIKDVALRAQWSQGYRFPSLNQLYLGTVHGQEGNTLPNPDLSPETSNSYEIGARITKGNVTADIAGFYTYSKNYITTRDLGNETGDSMFANMDKAHTWGAELYLDYTFPGIRLTPYTSATYLYRKYENTIDLIEDQGRETYKTSKTGTPPVQGLVGVKWEKEMFQSATLFTDLYMHWAAKAKTYEYDSTYEGDFVIRKDKAWQTFNFTVGMQGGEEHKWNVALSLRNLLDKNYRQADNTVDDPGFHAVLSAGIEF